MTGNLFMHCLVFSILATGLVVTGFLFWAFVSMIIEWSFRPVIYAYDFLLSWYGFRFLVLVAIVFAVVRPFLEVPQ